MPKDRGVVDLCYWLEEFHLECPEVQLHFPYVYCPTCRVVAHIDIVGTRLKPLETWLQGTELDEAVHPKPKKEPGNA